MIKVFKYFSQCYFHVRANRTLQFGNGYTSEHPLPQREILCIYLTIINSLNLISAKTNTKVFISHCGINSVNEVHIL